VEIVWFQKISIPPLQRVIGNSEGRGVLKGKSFKGMYEPKLEFPEGWGLEPKTNSLWEEYGYFLEKHIVTCTCSYMRCLPRELHIFMWQVIFTLAQLSLNGKKQYS